MNLIKTSSSACDQLQLRLQTDTNKERAKNPPFPHRGAGLDSRRQGSKPSHLQHHRAQQCAGTARNGCRARFLLWPPLSDPPLLSASQVIPKSICILYNKQNTKIPLILPKFVHSCLSVKLRERTPSMTIYLYLPTLIYSVPTWEWKYSQGKKSAPHRSKRLLTFSSDLSHACIHPSNF